MYNTKKFKKARAEVKAQAPKVQIQGLKTSSFDPGKVNPNDQSSGSKPSA